MTLKLAMMHSPKPAERPAKHITQLTLPPAITGAVESPGEFLMRIRESQRRVRSDWKGICTQ